MAWSSPSYWFDRVEQLRQASADRRDQEAEGSQLAEEAFRPVADELFDLYTADHG